MIRFVHGQAQKTGLPVFSSYGSVQQGATFGARLKHEAEKVFTKGYENLLIIGNDCPQLDSSLLEKAANLCEAGKTPLGPTEDGGIYLIGLSKSTFESLDFENLPWETSDLFCAFEALVHPEILPTYTDIDSPQELVFVTRSLCSKHQLKGFLLKLLGLNYHKPYRVSDLFFPLIVKRTKSLRAPPICQA